MENEFSSEFFFDKVYETRNFEINLFWKRSNYFLFLNISIAAGLFSASQNTFFLPILLSFVGIVSSYFWYRVNLGSKYWQSKWEEELAEFEEIVTKHRRLGVDFKKLKFFNVEKEYSDELVKKSLKRNKENYSKLRKKVNKGILKKPSVSYHMILLSALFMFFWLATMAYFIVSCLLANF